MRGSDSTESKGKYVPEEKQIKLKQFEQDNSVQFLQLINWLREERTDLCSTTMA